MTEHASAERASPAQALELRFEAILRGPMHGVPVLNPALRVQAVGFRPWGPHWLGVLITPWFMNLMLLPRLTAQWPAIGQRGSRHYVFPAGVFEFIGHHDAELGGYQACSLFSPMHAFADADGAQATALAALQTLFDAAQRPAMDLPAKAPAPAAAVVVPGPAPSSKRDFLFGHPPRASRGP